MKLTATNEYKKEIEIQNLFWSFSLLYAITYHIKSSITQEIKESRKLGKDKGKGKRKVELVIKYIE